MSRKMYPQRLLCKSIREIAIIANNKFIFNLFSSSDNSLLDLIFFIFMIELRHDLEMSHPLLLNHSLERIRKNAQQVVCMFCQVELIFSLLRLFLLKQIDFFFKLLDLGYQIFVRF